MWTQATPKVIDLVLVNFFFHIFIFYMVSYCIQILILHILKSDCSDKVGDLIEDSMNSQQVWESKM